MSDSTVARTIVSQINAIDPTAFAAWGAKNKSYTDNTFQFKSSGTVRWKGFVDIEYNRALDMYDIKFMRVRNMEVKVDKKVEGVCAPELVRVIDNQVG